MEKLSVDRIEGDFAVCEREDLSHFSVPLVLFGFEVKEGMIIYRQADGTYKRDVSEEEKMRMKISALQKKLMNNSGD